MTKSNKPNRQAKPQKRPNGIDLSGLLLTCTDIVSRVGMPGFLLISIVSFVFLYSSPNQKLEIIDKWLLFNNNSNSQPFSITVVIFAVIIYLIQTYTFMKIRALDRAEIDRLSKYKKEYQEDELKQGLKSSTT